MARRELHDLGSIRHLPAAFDRERWGLNLTVGAAYSLVVLLFEASEYLLLPFTGASGGASGGGFGLAVFYAATVVLVVLVGVAFTLVVHGVRRLWTLVLTWAAVAAAFEASFRGLAALLADLPPQPLPDALLVAEAALDGALLLLGLAVAVGAWGVCAEAFVVGAVGACLVHAVPLKLVVAALRPDIAWGWPHFLGWALVRGLLTGSLLYAGVAAHFIARRSAPPGPR